MRIRVAGAREATADIRISPVDDGEMRPFALRRRSARPCVEN